MPLVTNEQNEKRETMYPKYEAENTLFIKSNLYKLGTHYLRDVKKSVACKGVDKCYFCKNNLQKRSEYNYYVSLNGQLGVLDIKPSVFFSINAIERATKKDKKQYSWLVIKSGQGLDTEYTVSKDDKLSDEDFKKLEKELTANNEKLEKIMRDRESKLEENYLTYSQEEPAEQKKQDSQQVEADVDSDDIPF